MVSQWDKWDEALFMGNNVFEVEQFWINALTRLGSGCQKELLQTVKVPGPVGHNKHNKMHFSAGHKSVIHVQRVNLEWQPRRFYYNRLSKGSESCRHLNAQSHRLLEWEHAEVLIEEINRHLIELNKQKSKMTTLKQ